MSPWQPTAHFLCSNWHSESVLRSSVRWSGEATSTCDVPEGELQLACRFFRMALFFSTHSIYWEYSVCSQSTSVSLELHKFTSSMRVASSLVLVSPWLLLPSLSVRVRAAEGGEIFVELFAGAAKQQLKSRASTMARPKTRPRRSAICKRCKGIFGRRRRQIVRLF